MYPVFPLVVSDASIQGGGRKDQDKMLGSSNAVNQLLVERPRVEFINVNENWESAQLEVYLQQTERSNKYIVNMHDSYL